MIKESELLKAIVQAGLTFSPEKDDGYIMRNIDAIRVVKAVIKYLSKENPVAYDSYPKAWVWIDSEGFHLDFPTMDCD